MALESARLRARFDVSSKDAFHALVAHYRQTPLLSEAAPVAKEEMVESPKSTAQAHKEGEAPIQKVLLGSASKASFATAAAVAAQVCHAFSHNRLCGVASLMLYMQFRLPPLAERAGHDAGWRRWRSA